MTSCGSYYPSQARVIRAQRSTFSARSNVQLASCIFFEAYGGAECYLLSNERRRETLSQVLFSTVL